MAVLCSCSRDCCNPQSPLPRSMPPLLAAPHPVQCYSEPRLLNQPCGTVEVGGQQKTFECAENAGLYCDISIGRCVPAAKEVRSATVDRVRTKWSTAWSSLKARPISCLLPSQLRAAALALPGTPNHIHCLPAPRRASHAMRTSRAPRG